MTRGITFGTFDVFHYGHLRILERSREMCDRLVVGISSDELNFSKKQRYPYYSYEERARIVGALRCVDEDVRRADQRFVLTLWSDGRLPFFPALCSDLRVTKGAAAALPGCRPR